MILTFFILRYKSKIDYGIIQHMTMIIYQQKSCTIIIISIYLYDDYRREHNLDIVLKVNYHKLIPVLKDGFLRAMASFLLFSIFQNISSCSELSKLLTSLNFCFLSWP